MNSVEVHKLAGTDNANSRAWSPDGRYLAFGRAGKFEKIDISGGTPEAICNYPSTLYGIAWGKSDVLVFSTGTVIHRVSPSGGDVTDLTQLDAKRDDLGVGGPSFLPDGQHSFICWWPIRNPGNVYRFD